STLAPADRLFFMGARFADLSEELALARLHLRALLARGVPDSDVLLALNMVARIVKLRHDIDQSRYEHGPEYLHRKLPW
ncbi:MAG TPA: hypothetical protein VK457_14985, partial [Chloroflexota bacterium]|nr:hypothetical protein [Chloroflexota bacterium]